MKYPDPELVLHSAFVFRLFFVLCFLQPVISQDLFPRSAVPEIHLVLHMVCLIYSFNASLQKVSAKEEGGQTGVRAPLYF